LLALPALLAGAAQASEVVIKIGVLNDQTGIYAGFGGAGSVVAARMAVEDMGGSVLGKPIEVAVGDHQNKADIGVAIVRRWFDVDHVDMIVDLSNSAVALAVETIAKERNRIAIAGAVGTPDFTGKDCTPPRRRGSTTATRSAPALRAPRSPKGSTLGSSSPSTTLSGIRSRPMRGAPSKRRAAR
jgi:branched-chain amino acid transport system substrate-binding protein